MVIALQPMGSNFNLKIMKNILYYFPCNFSLGKKLSQKIPHILPENSFRRTGGERGGGGGVLTIFFSYQLILQRAEQTSLDKQLDPFLLLEGDPYQYF